MAQHHQSRATWFVTLTYGGGYGNAAAYELDRHHLDVFLRNLRARGHKFKPVSVGEYGSERGRAHWHVLLFWESEPPKLPMNQRFHWTYEDKRGIERAIWPHGTVQVELPRSLNATVAYVLAYLDKSPGERGEFSFGKRPAVGENYLLQFARDRARNGHALFPRGKPIYQVPGNVKDRGPSAGQPYDYWLDPSSAILDRMIIAYLMEWHRYRPGQLPPFDKFVSAWVLECDGSERMELLPDAVRQQLASIDRLLRRGQLDDGMALAFHATDDPDCVLARCATTGAMEFRWYDEEGDLTWRESISGKSLEEALRRPPELPEEAYPAGRAPLWDLWTDPSIRPRQRRHSMPRSRQGRSSPSGGRKPE